MRDVTIVVVSFNTCAQLRACLASMRGLPPEVYVVDNGSTDGSTAVVRDEFPEVHLVETGTNLGFGAAANLGARQTSSAWLVVANADVELSPGALDRLLETAEADPSAGAVAPRLVLPDGRTQHSVYAFPTVWFAALFALGLAGDRLCVPGRWDPERARRVPWAVGAFLLLRREAWDAAGGFDEAQWMYAEDLELGHRLRRAGWHTRYEPRAVVHHREAVATEAAFGWRRRERWQRATYAWILRRRGVVVLRLIAALNVAASLRLRRWDWAKLHLRTGLLARRESLHRTR